MTTTSTLTVRARRPALRAPTRRSCEAAGRFGLSLDAETQPTDGPAFDLDTRPGALTLITGPSGAGKTSLLLAVERAARARDWPVIRPDRLRIREAPAVDILRERDVESAMRALARAGLADAACFVRRPSEMSEGQRTRLRLALALSRADKHARAGRPALLLLDEFASGLDALTALGVAALLRKCITRPGAVRAVVATARDDLAAALRPDRAVRINLRGETRPDAPAPHDLAPESRFVFDPDASAADYEPLAWLHYKAGPPANIVRAVACRDILTNEPLGALTVSMPTLNGAWRALAWPDQYTTGNRAEDAARLNADVRRISRVVVDPRVRGLGIATRLVRTYLQSADTPRTEALAAMGACSRFFEAAGMTAHTTPPPERHARLLDALHAAGVEPWRLAQPAAAWQRATRAAGGADFWAAELRRWANASRAARSLSAADPFTLFKAACRAIACTPVAFIHDRHSAPPIDTA